MTHLKQFWINVYTSPRNLADHEMTLAKPIRIHTISVNAENSHMALLAANAWARGMAFVIKHIQVQNQDGTDIREVMHIAHTDVSYEQLCHTKRVASEEAA